MSKSGRNKKGSEDKSKNEYFSWSDDEAELLLKVTIDYKTSKAMENVDWESCQTKYQDILDKYLEQYPSPEEALALGKDYPHAKDEMTKVILTSKLKIVRQKYPKAVDSGRRSGHGRVVLLYFELCEEIWGGSPASNAIESGLESAEIHEFSSANHEEMASSTPSPASSVVMNDSTDFQDSVDTPVEDHPEERLPSSVVRERRELLDSKLAGHKKEKLKRKPRSDSQLLICAQEELKIKKQMLERMEATDKEHSEYMKKMFCNMERLTSSMADGFALLRQVMLPQPAYTTGPRNTPHYFHQNPPSSYVHVGHAGFSSRIPTASPHSQIDSQHHGQYSYTNSLSFSDDLNGSDGL